MNIPLIGLAVALAIVGVQTTRLANEKADHHKTVSDHASHQAVVSQQIEAATQKMRTLEQAIAQRNLENANEQARLKADAARRIADAQRATAGLRDTIATLSRRDRPTDPAAAGWFDAAAVAGRLVGECSERRQEVATAAIELTTQVTGLQRYVAEVCLAANSSTR